MPQLQSGVGLKQENERLFWPDQIQHCSLQYYDLLVCLPLLESPVLLALWKFHAPGTIKVQCPWDYKMFTAQILLANMSGLGHHLSG